MSRNVSLSDAIVRYRAQRVHDAASKSELQRDQRMLAAFLATNGSIWVRSIDERHIGRALEDQSSGHAETLVEVLDPFLAWCSQMSFLPATSDPLGIFRQGGAVRPVPPQFLRAGRCHHCGFEGLVERLKIAWSSGSRPINFDVCSRCCKLPLAAHVRAASDQP
jgi:hypothetical protein